MNFNTRRNCETSSFRLVKTKRLSLRLINDVDNFELMADTGGGAGVSGIFKRCLRGERNFQWEKIIVIGNYVYKYL